MQMTTKFSEWTKIRVTMNSMMKIIVFVSSCYMIHEITIKYNNCMLCYIVLDIQIYMVRSSFEKCVFIDIYLVSSRLRSDCLKFLIRQRSINIASNKL